MAPSGQPPGRRRYPGGGGHRPHRSNLAGRRQVHLRSPGPRVPATSSVSGVVLADQVKSLDWRARCARFESHAPRQVSIKPLAKLLNRTYC